MVNTHSLDKAGDFLGVSTWPWVPGLDLSNHFHDLKGPTVGWFHLFDPVCFNTKPAVLKVLPSCS